jgi:cell division protein FtsL
MLRIHLNSFLLLVIIILFVYIYESHSQLSVLQDTISQLVLEIEDMKKINSDLVASIEKLKKAQRSSELPVNNNVLNHGTIRYYLIVLASALGWYHGSFR